MTTKKNTSDRVPYTGKKRAIFFLAPPKWLQGELRGTYSYLEVAFYPPDAKDTQLQYSCLDLIEKNNLPESMRPELSMDFFTEDSIKQMIGDTVTGLTVEKKNIEGNEWFILKGTKIIPLVSAVNIENGYIHQFTLYETNTELLSAHENDLLLLLRSVNFSHR